MKFKALANINGRPGDRVKGEIFDLPQTVAKPLIARGLIEPAPADEPAESPAPAPAAKPARAPRKA